MGRKMGRVRAKESGLIMSLPNDNSWLNFGNRDRINMAADELDQ
jgi:hypothetical protein